jgi:hypothetical protein
MAWHSIVRRSFVCGIPVIEGVDREGKRGQERECVADSWLNG